MNGRRLVVYLLLNALVSAAATLTVLWLWERTRPPVAPSAPLVATATPPAAASLASPPPSAVAAVTPVLPTPTVYVVKSGDSLGSIAQRYDVSIDAIMAANGLTDPNLLFVGLALVIPVEGSVPPTPEADESLPPATTVVEPPRPTATRDPSAAQPRLAIREVRAAGDLAGELLVIVNDGGPVDLAGWSLRDGTGRAYTFPSLMLFQGGAVTVHTAAGADTVTDLYWGQSQAVWTPGQEVLLNDAAGNLHTRFAIP